MATEIRPRPRDRGVVHLEVASSAFRAGERIPGDHTRDGANVSPDLRWSGAPARARSFVVVCDDPDASCEDETGSYEMPAPHGLVHWIIWNVTGQGLPENVSRAGFEAAGAQQGMNDFGARGYDGPEPPRRDDPHRYHFRVYALDVLLDVPPDASKTELLQAMRDHLVAYGELVGTYSR